MMFLLTVCSHVLGVVVWTVKYQIPELINHDNTVRLVTLFTVG